MYNIILFLLKYKIQQLITSSGYSLSQVSRSEFNRCQIQSKLETITPFHTPSSALNRYICMPCLIFIINIIRHFEG